MIVPKPGEFFVVSSDTMPSLNRKLITQAILDSHNPTPKSRLGSRVGNGPGQTQMHASKSSNNFFQHTSGARTVKPPSLTDRKVK